MRQRAKDGGGGASVRAPRSDCGHNVKAQLISPRLLKGPGYMPLPF